MGWIEDYQIRSKLKNWGNLGKEAEDSPKFKSVKLPTLSLPNPIPLSSRHLTMYRLATGWTKDHQIRSNRKMGKFRKRNRRAEIPILPSNRAAGFGGVRWYLRWSTAGNREGTTVMVASRADVPCTPCRAAGGAAPRTPEGLWPAAMTTLLPSTRPVPRRLLPPSISRIEAEATRLNKTGEPRR